jgi:DNA polymerase III epsilon subunit-like protein
MIFQHLFPSSYNMADATGYIGAQVQLKLAQKYLGLRPVLVQVPADPLANPNLDHVHTDLKKFLSERRSNVLQLPPVDENEVAPFPFHHQVRLVCLDVEAWEKNRKIITELGVAVLDTNDTALVPPGSNAINWQSLVHAKHYRIYEYEHLTNTTYVAHTEGYTPKFRYGESETIRQGELVTVLHDLFHVFSPENELRDVIVVGHDIRSDIDLLNLSSHDIKQIPTVKGTLDSQALWRAINPPGAVQSQSSLKHLLISLGISFSTVDLHNAGNDALLTMHAVLSIVLKEATIRPDISNSSDDNAFRLPVGCVDDVVASVQALNTIERNEKRSKLDQKRYEEQKRIQDVINLLREDISELPPVVKEPSSD